jgi:hypothetical protein
LPTKTIPSTFAVNLFHKKHPKNENTNQAYNGPAAVAKRFSDGRTLSSLSAYAAFNFPSREQVPFSIAEKDERNEKNKQDDGFVVYLIGLLPAVDLWATYRGEGGGLPGSTTVGRCVGAGGGDPAGRDNR